MEQCGLAAAGRPHDAEKFSRLHLQIDVVEGEQPLTALGAVTQANVAQADLGHSGQNYPAGAARHQTRFARTTEARWTARVDGNRNLCRKIMCVRTHGIAFLPFSARTWLRSVKS